MMQLFPAKRLLPALLMMGRLILSDVPGFSQDEDPILNKVMKTWDRYADRHRAPGLFLHLDKSIYEPAEHVQFTAYLLGGHQDTTQLHALYVLLVNPVTRKMVIFSRFVLSRYTGTGALYLPDSLDPGKYLVIAYTDEQLEELEGAEEQSQRSEKRSPGSNNLLQGSNEQLQGSDQRMFRQEITLLPNLPTPFSIARLPDTTRLQFRVATDYGGLASGASFHYRLQADGRTIDSGEKKIDAFGEVSLPPPPAAAQLMLSATVRRQAEVAHLWLPVAANSREWRVHYYPEGGDLVAGRPCQTGIEIRDAAGNGVRTQGRLLENGEPVADFHTDDNGWGRLVAIFLPGRSYSIDFPDKPSGVLIRDSLPAVKPEGYSLLVPDGVARDSVDVQLYFPAPGLTCRLMLYTDREIVYASTILAHGAASRISIPVQDWPAGILTMTLFDPDGLPVAERKLYSPPPVLSVTIRTDSTSYHTRSKIRLQVRTTDANGAAIQALFSLSTVLSSRLQPDQDPDIRRYAAIDRFLTPGPVGYLAPGPLGSLTTPPVRSLTAEPVPGLGPDYGISRVQWENDSVTDLLLLIRGWTRYHWQELASDSLSLHAGESLYAGERFADYGYVLYRDKRPTTPLTMLVLGGSLSTFSTDSAGRFRIPPATLVSEKSSDLALSLSGGDKQDEYRIVLLNEYERLNQSIAGAWYVPLPVLPDISSEGAKGTHPFSQAKTLQKVIVHHGHNGIEGCLDYVCIMGILNCKNHPYGRKPVIGETVLVPYGYNGFRPMVYTGCEQTEPVFPPFLRRIKPIYLLRDSYRNDTTAIPPSVTALYTTLHWAPMVLTDASGFAEISFYANDLPGLYYNILQGISQKGVISGKQSFRIVKDNDNE